jgi:hypothetical protein
MLVLLLVGLMVLAIGMIIPPPDGGMPPVFVNLSESHFIQASLNKQNCLS